MLDESEKSFETQQKENGLIKDCSNYFVTRDGHVFSRRGECKIHLQDTGYYRCVLKSDLRDENNNRIAKGFYIHRLVALAHIPLVEGKNCVDHIDEDKSHNYVDHIDEEGNFIKGNLRWCTHQENNQWARESGKNPINSIKVRCLENDKEYDSIREVQKDFDINYNIGKREILNKKNPTNRTWAIVEEEVVADNTLGYIPLKKYQHINGIQGTFETLEQIREEQ